MAHALNPRFYDEEIIAQSNGKRKAPEKGREVANGVKKALVKMLLAHIDKEVTIEFANFTTRLDDYSNKSALEERSTMSPVRLRISHGANVVNFQKLAICVSGKLFVNKK